MKPLRWEVSIIEGSALLAVYVAIAIITLVYISPFGVFFLLPGVVFFYLFWDLAMVQRRINQLFHSEEPI